nr:hypothetical protein [Hyphomonas sp. Mor2]
MSLETIVSYWGVPSKTDSERYGRVIEALAKAQGGARFTPHISLGSLEQHDPEMDDVLAELKDLTVHPRGLGRSDVFTTSLFVDLAQSAQLDLARARLARRDGFRSSRTFSPHISLCYGPPVNEEAVAADIQALLSTPVKIDRVQAVEIAIPVTTYAQVAAWAPIETFVI